MPEESANVTKLVRKSRTQLEQSSDDLQEQMQRVFRSRVELAQQGHNSDIVPRAHYYED